MSQYCLELVFSKAILCSVRHTFVPLSYKTDWLNILSVNAHQSRQDIDRGHLYKNTIYVSTCMKNVVHSTSC